MHFDLEYIYITEGVEDYLLYNFLTQKFIFVKKDKLRIDPIILVGYGCNYACDYCYEYTQKGNSDKFTAKMLDCMDGFYDEYCMLYGVEKKYNSISLVGGEPLLESNRGLIEKVVEKWENIPIRVSTNGVNIKRFLNIFNGRRCIFNVSLDGIKEIHYKHRHPKENSYYELTIEGIREALNCGHSVNIITVYDPMYSTFLKDFLDQLEYLGWPSKNITLRLIPKLNGSKVSDKAYMKESLGALAKLISEEKRMKHVDIMKFVPGIQCFISNNESIYGCQRLQDNDFIFLPDGRVTICHVSGTPILDVGTFFSKININMRKIELIRNRNINNLKKCLDCKFRKLCRGGCTAASVQFENRIEKEFCYYWEDESWKIAYDTIGYYILKNRIANE